MRCMPPPLAPPFVIKAPPTVPGIPVENSKPTRPFFNDLLSTKFKEAPDSAVKLPSEKKRILFNFLVRLYLFKQIFPIQSSF